DSSGGARSQARQDRGHAQICACGAGPSGGSPGQTGQVHASPHLPLSPSPLLRLSAAAPAAITEKPVRVSSVSKASAAAQEPPSPKAPKVKRVKP
ncbi:MAG: hypothetical protein WAV70_06870, partial [Anaerolineae bacterium]